MVYTINGSKLPFMVVLESINQYRLTFLYKTLPGIYCALHSFDNELQHKCIWKKQTILLLYCTKTFFSFLFFYLFKLQ